MVEKNLPNPEPLMQMMQGAQVSGLLFASLQLDLYSKLADGPATADEIAARIGCPVRSTRILANALTALGLLVKDGAKYALTPTTETFLVSGKPTFIGSMASLFGSHTFWEGSERFAEAVKNDGTVLSMHAETPKAPFWEMFAQCTGPMAFPASAALDGHLASWIAGKAKVRVLDIAAGSGIYGFTLAKHPNVELTSLDWPNVLTETRAWADRLGVDKSRTSYIEGNLFEVDFKGPYDLVLLSHVYHHFDRPTCLGLTRKVAAALAPGGRVAVQDFITDEKVSQPMPSLFAASMLMWTRKGEAFSESDYNQWFVESGLKPAGMHASAGMPASFLFADKA